MVHGNSGVRCADLLNALKNDGINNPRVLRAIASVPREEFVSPHLRKIAYLNQPLDIGHGQTISQPFTVAFMLEALAIEPDSQILEIGTGSGYNSALLATLASRGHVWTVEILEPLYRKASEKLRGWKNVTCIRGDGAAIFDLTACTADNTKIKTKSRRACVQSLAEQGVPTYFDRIVSTASAPSLPLVWVEHLKDGGIFVGPIGEVMIRGVKEKGRLIIEDHGRFLFVPLRTFKSPAHARV